MTRTTLAAFLVAAAVPTVINGIITLPGQHFLFPQMVGFAALSYLITLAFVAVFAWPVYRWLFRLGLIRLWTCLLAALCLALVILVIFRAPELPQLSDAYVFGSEGLAAGAVFWLIWRRGARRQV
jgi:hypothetical protein